jgi:hypothetical protein
MTDSLHDTARSGGAVGEKTTAAGLEPSAGGPSMFDSKGAIGKQFTTQGVVGGMAQKLGGPLDKEGVLGRQFKKDGSIGGTVENVLGDAARK